MNKINDLIFSLDIGTRSIKGAILHNINGTLNVVAEHYIEHEERAMLDGQIHDIGSVAKTVALIKSNLEDKIKLKLTNVAIAAAGRFLRTINVTINEDIYEDQEIDNHIINALELSAVQKAEEEINKNLKSSYKKSSMENTKLYCVGYTVKSYYLNKFSINSLLSHKGKNAGVEIIATFLPSSVVDSLYAVMKLVDLKVSTLTLEPIAAMDALIPPNLRLLNICLVDIGAGTSDIAISNKNTVVGYGMVPLAGDEVTEAIAENYLIDFNTAESIKQSIMVNDEITYTDVLGYAYTITSKEVLSIITPVVEKISMEIAKEITKLNNDKSPSAVFLVGGGAHTPMLMEMLTSILNLPPQRIVIKGRESVKECHIEDYSLGSMGVTVLGIGLIASNKSFENYIEVNLNNTHLTLFNLNNTRISDVLMQASINPKLLIGKNGKDLTFSLNGSVCKALGGSPTEAKILLNDEQASLDSPISNGDNIEIIYAKNGSNACPRVYEYIPSSYDNINFYVDGVLFNIEAKILINDIHSKIDSIIKKDDIVTLEFDDKLSSFINNHNNIFKNRDFYIGSEKLKNNYIIKSNDNIVTKLLDIKKCVLTDVNPNITKDVVINNKTANNEITVIVNNKPVKLVGKKSYVFIDIFDYIDFDRENSKGLLTLLHNGNPASYLSNIAEKDIIEVFWS